MKSLFKNSIFNIIYTLLNILFPFITSIYLSNILLPEGIGTIGYARNIASYFVSFASLGMQVYGIREIAKAGKDQKTRNKVFTSLIFINAISTFIACACYFILIFSLNIFSADKTILAICGIAIIFNFINIDWLYQGLEEYGYITLRSFVMKALMLIATVLLVKNLSDIYVYAMISVLANGGNYAFNVIQMRKYVKLDFKDIKIKQHLKPLIVIAVCQFLSTLYHRVDVTMLGALFDKAWTGYYTYAHDIINIICSMCVAITSVFLPKLSLYYKEDKAKFKELVEQGVRILWTLCIPAMIGVWVLAEDVIVALYGQGFFLSAKAMQWFSALIILNPVGNLLGYQVVICIGEENKRVPVFVAGTVVNIIFNAILIPKYFHIGAAVASVIAEIIIFLVQVIYLCQKFKFKIFDIQVLKIIISAIIMGVIVCILRNVIENVYVKLIICLTVGVVSYFLLNLVLKNTIIFEMLDSIKMLIQRSKDKE